MLLLALCQALVTVREARVASRDFMQSIDVAGRALDDVSESRGSVEVVRSFTATPEGCRGLFVSMLATTEARGAVADHPVVVEALSSGDDYVAKLSAMNLVMSAATAVAHDENGDSENAAASRETNRRAARLVEATLPSPLGNLQRVHLDAILKATTDPGDDFWSTFLHKYHQRQCAAINACVADLVC